jgi:hypothetical protein
MLDLAVDPMVDLAVVPTAVPTVGPMAALTAVPTVVPTVAPIVAAKALVEAIAELALVAVAATAPPMKAMATAQKSDAYNIKTAISRA